MRDRLPILFAGIKVLAHLVVGNGYGYFRDEFYYLACSRNLAWGYVDHPPLSVAVLRAWTTLFGDSVVAIRLLAVLAGAAAIYLIGWIARRLGGGPFAQALAMTAAVVAPIYLSAGSSFSMNSFDLLFWTAAAGLLIRILEGGEDRLWPWLGLLLGLGLLNKISVLWLGFGLFVALLLTGYRRVLATRGPWIAGGIAALVFLPHIVWQIAHDWPTLEFIRNATGEKMRSVAIGEFVVSQVRMLHPLVLPIWLGGLGYLLFHRDARPYRFLALIWISVAALLIVNGASRPGYLGPAYPALLAAGGVAVERLLAPQRLRLLRPALIGLLVLGGLLLAPVALPILPVESYIAYAETIGIAPSTSERKELAELPQHFADMFGWTELADEIERVTATLTPQEREVVCVFTYNYGEAGALQTLGRGRGLPPAISGHNNYWLWGPGDCGGLLLVIGGTEAGHTRLYESAEQVGMKRCDYCMPYEDDVPIWLLRGPKETAVEFWPSIAHFD